MNVQECARELRYQVYEEVAGEINITKIALGHTADDQAETVLMWLLRGTGPRGLSGIPPVRQRIIRPLIELERKDIEEFLAAYPLFTDNDTLPHYVLDSSNLRSQYLRNWIRHKLIPEMKKINPALINTINRVADIFREEDDYLELIVTKTLMKLISRKRDDTLELFLTPLEHMAIPLLRRVIRRALNDTKGLRGIDFIHIEDIVKLIKTGKSGDRIYLPKKIKAIKSYATLILTSKAPVKLQTRILESPGKLFLEEVSLMLTAEITENMEKACNGRETAVIDYDMISFPLYVRGRKSGDFFCPAEFARRKKLQDFFVDSKVPRDERPAIPLVTTREDIVWVAGYRMDERFKASEKTKKFLILKIFKV
jgi:tRNA(Ile)-lysidine synthase